MELLIVRNGETQTNNGLKALEDHPLTMEGMRQAAVTALWLSQNFHYKGFRGLVSPHLSCLQTASAISTLTEIEFFVNPDLRDYRADGATTKLEDRSLPFQNLIWSPQQWDGQANTYPGETPDEFVDRCSTLFYNANESDYDKLLVVTHGVPNIVLAELNTGIDPAEIKKRLTMSQDASPMEELIKSLGMQMLYNSVQPCGLTYIQEGEPLWFGRVVHG
jgi:broad specificity phosphatase PhoE